MLEKLESSCVIGIDAYLVDVEVDIANGLPGFSIVGLPDPAIRESKDRIRAAIKNSGFKSYRLTPTILRSREAICVGLGIVRSLV